MNEAETPSINLDDLRLMPAWLREEGPPPAQQYARHEGERDDRRGAGRFDGRSSDRGGDRRESRGPRPGGGADRGRGRPGAGGPARPQGGPGNRDGGRREGRDGEFRRAEPPATAPARPAPLRIEFQPDDRCLASIVKQIRSTHLAYPLFGLARMFLQEPERHWLQLTLEPDAVAAGVQLYQAGEHGPVTLDRQILEKIAFDEHRERFYAEQSELKEPLKGNYTNVARDRLSGTLLGPTNYHGYQPALRGLYESRFSRRMSFEDYRRNIEIVTDPAVVERWKEEARTTTSIVTREGEPPTVLATVADARTHFREHHLEGLLRAGTVFRVHGSVARTLPEPSVMQAIREAHERELRYPAQFVQLLRQGLQNAGLHIFKHRKRVVYVSLARPVPFVADGAVSAHVLAILDAVAETPLITRKALAARVLGDGKPGTEPVPPGLPAEPAAGAVAPAPPASEDPLAKARAALAADVRFLVQAGHIIEFHNGTFDLPLPPKAKEEAEPAAPPAKAPATATPPITLIPEPAEPVESAESPHNEEPAPAVEADTHQHAAFLSEGDASADAEPPGGEPTPESAPQEGPFK